MEKLRLFMQRTLGTVRHHVGTDQHGNRYFYYPKQKSWTGQVMRQKRAVEAVEKEVYKYEFGAIPTEWEAWIRGKREDPPTIEEILNNEKMREEVKIKSQKLLRQEEGLQSTEDRRLIAEPVKTQIKGHASAPFYGKHSPSEEPSSTANVFEPGSWKPQEK